MEYTLSEKTFNAKLKENYREGILISRKTTHLAIACFIDTIYEINLRAVYKKNKEEGRTEIRWSEFINEHIHEVIGQDR